MKFVYLASPYSHTDLAVMEDRFECACKVAAALMGEGYSVFSPIAHSHPLAAHMAEKLRTDFEFWMTQDLPILRFADELWVLMLPGWENSRGIKREMEYAASLGVHIHYLSYERKAA